jgi:hypothetical protein
MTIKNYRKVFFVEKNSTRMTLIERINTDFLYSLLSL